MTDDGDYKITATREMAAFDQLPKTLRRALSEATRNFHSEDVLGEWNRRGCAKTVKKLKAFDKRLARQRAD